MPHTTNERTNDESNRIGIWQGSEYWVLCRVYEGWTHKKDFADVSNLSPIYFAQNMFSPKLSSSSRNYCSWYYDDLVKICFFSLNLFFSSQTPVTVRQLSTRYVLCTTWMRALWWRLPDSRYILLWQVGIKTFFSHRKIGVYSERLMFRSLNNDNKNQETLSALVNIHMVVDCFSLMVGGIQGV